MEVHPKILEALEVAYASAHRHKDAELMEAIEGLKEIGLDVPAKLREWFNSLPQEEQRALIEYPEG